MISCRSTKNLIETLTETESSVAEIRKFIVEMDKKIAQAVIVRGITNSDLPKDLHDGITNLNNVFDTMNKSFVLMIKQQVEIDRQLSKYLASGR